MIEDDLMAVAERCAPEVRADLADIVLARLDASPERAPRTRVRVMVASALSALLLAFGLSPQVRAVAADLLEVAGIDVSWGEPDAAPEPAEPLPGSSRTELDEARAAAAFPVGVPEALGEPDDVTVADGGRVVTLTWATVSLDQFEGRVGPVFAKEVEAGRARQEVEVAGTRGWWFPRPHDLTYVDRDGEWVTATARLAGATLVWEGSHGVTFRLEGVDLSLERALEIAESFE